MDSIHVKPHTINQSINHKVDWWYEFHFRVTLVIAAGSKIRCSWAWQLATGYCVIFSFILMAQRWITRSSAYSVPVPITRLPRVAKLYRGGRHVLIHQNLRNCHYPIPPFLFYVQSAIKWSWFHFAGIFFVKGAIYEHVIYSWAASSAGQLKKEWHALVSGLWPNLRQPAKTKLIWKKVLCF